MRATERFPGDSWLSLRAGVARLQFWNVFRQIQRLFQGTGDFEGVLRGAYEAVVFSGLGNKGHANCLGNSVQQVINSLVGGGAWVLVCFPLYGSREPGGSPGGFRAWRWQVNVMSVGCRALDKGHNLSFPIHKDLTQRFVVRMA